jgi:hypothetical protein
VRETASLPECGEETGSLSYNLQSSESHLGINNPERPLGSSTKISIETLETERNSNCTFLFGF